MSIHTVGSTHAQSKMRFRPFTARVVKHWNRLARDESPSLEVLKKKKSVAVVLKDMV